MTVSYFLKLLSTFGVLIIVSYALFKLSQTFKQRRFSGDIKIIDRCAIDSNASLVIVTVRDKEFLMSVSNKVLHVIEEL